MRNIMTIIKKEFIDILRDRKTLIMTFLVPIIIMPVIFTFLFSSISDMANPSEENRYQVLVNTNEQAVLDMMHTIPIIEVNSGSGTEAIQKAHDGDVVLYVEVDPAFQEKLQNNQTPTIKLYYDTTSQNAETVVQAVQSVFTSYQTTMAMEILRENHLPDQLLFPFHYEVIAKDESIDGVSAMLLGMMIPMMLIGYSVNGITPIAADLGAGEKERGTLEPLLSTSVSRSAILIAKLVVIATFGVITSIFSTIGIFVALQYGMSDNVVTFPISIGGLSWMIFLTAMYSIFMSAIMLMVSTFARSLKEANTYLVPFTLVPIFLSMITMYSDVNTIAEYMMHIPILNVVCVIKEIVLNKLNMSHIYITVAWSITYVVISLILARKMYNKEEIIFRT